MNRKYKFNSGIFRQEMLAYRNMLLRSSGKIKGYETIKCCTRWKKSFDNFMEDMHPKPVNSILDRKNNSKGYSKSNCRWVLAGASQFNRRKFKGSLDLPFGVFRCKKSDKYISQICIQKKKYHLGTFNTSLEARKAYEKIALEWYGYLN